MNTNLKAAIAFFHNFYFIGLTFFFSPMANAHLRWFVEKPDIAAPSTLPLDINTFFIFLANFLIIGLALAYSYTSTFRPIKLIQSWIHHKLPQGFEWKLIAILTGLMLWGNTFTSVFLAPNIHVTQGWLFTTGLILQFILGGLLIFQRSITIPALAIVLVAVTSLFFVPLSVIIDYLFEFVGLGLALALIGPRINSFDSQLFKKIAKLSQMSKKALPLARIATGLTLITLGIHDKLIDPNLGVSFLKKYPLNFLPSLGFHTFSDLHFTYAAGITEVVFGLLILFGLAIPLTTLIVAGFFVTTLFIFGIHELIGHAPIFGIAFMLIARGGGTLGLTYVTLFNRRKIPRISFASTPALRFAFSAEPSIQLPIINLNYQGLALRTNLKLKDLLLLSKYELNGKIITPFGETAAKVTILDCKEGILHCVFNDNYSNYLPSIRDILIQGYSANNFERRDIINNLSSAEIWFDQGSEVRVKLFKDKYSNIYSFTAKHSINGHTFEMSFTNSPVAQRQFSSTHPDKFTSEKMYYLLVALIERHQIERSESFMLDYAQMVSSSFPLRTQVISSEGIEAS
jgi:uncharacterized membrane protein YphA (DoxX/SURF4 family)